MLHLLSPFRHIGDSATRVALVAGALALGLCVATPTATRADDGFATWYGPGFQGNVMYNGQTYNMYDPTTTAASFSFPMGTWVKVTNPANGRSVVVQVRDRGAFHYAFDLSYAAFKQIAEPNLMGIPISYQIVTGPAGNPPAAPRAAPSSRGGRPAPATQYVVQPGDTLSGIASQLAIDAGSLAAWNGIADPNLLAPGQTLRLTAPAAVAAPAALVPVVARSTSYVVQPGDSLLALAAQFNVSADSLAAANNLTDPYTLVVGQSLVIPSAGATAAPRTYTVQPGDTLFVIAGNLNIGVDALAAANQITDPNNLQPGTVLTVPSQ